MHNLFRSARLDGLCPMIGDPTRPLVDVRRADRHTYVAASGLAACHDETNDAGSTSWSGPTIGPWATWTAASCVRGRWPACGGGPRARLRSSDRGDGSHRPSFDEIKRVIAVVRGESVATELAGGRRVARRVPRLRVE